MSHERSRSEHVQSDLGQLILRVLRVLLLLEPSLRALRKVELPTLLRPVPSVVLLAQACLAVWQTLVVRNVRVDAERAARGSFVLAVTSFHRLAATSCSLPLRALTRLCPVPYCCERRAVRPTEALQAGLCATTGRSFGCYALDIPQETTGRPSTFAVGLSVSLR